MLKILKKKNSTLCRQLIKTGITREKWNFLSSSKNIYKMTVPDCKQSTLNADSTFYPRFYRRIVKLKKHRNGLLFLARIRNKNF